MPEKGKSQTAYTHTHFDCSGTVKPRLTAQKSVIYAIFRVIETPGQHNYGGKNTTFSSNMRKCYYRAVITKLYVCFIVLECYYLISSLIIYFFWNIHNIPFRMFPSNHSEIVLETLFTYHYFSHFGLLLSNW